MKKKIFTALLLSQLVFSQQLPVAEVLPRFNGEQIQFSLPISGKENVTLTWHERKSSFSDKNIRSFVAYHDGHFVGVLSISGNEAFGNISWEGHTYSLSTENGKISITKEENHTCGTCERGYCSVDEHSHEEHHHKPLTSKYQILNTNQEQFQNTPEIYSDAIFREYRLAVLVDYSAYTTWFGSDINRVKQHLAQLEVFINEVYKRDLGVKFVIVDDPKLIRTSQDQEVFTSSDRNWRGGGSYVSTHSTKRIDNIITSKNYDVGITICVTSSEYAGLADLNNAHILEKKAAAWARYNIKTMAHEIGHLFGSQHTFSEGGILTMKTEPGRGTSLMSYGLDTARDFFSLPSISSIRQSMLVNAPGYFTDREHTQKVGDHNPRGNAVFGIDTQNKAPRIDRSKVKKVYRLPKETYFQFDIKASDPEGHALLYMAHQADIIENSAPSKANFLSRKASFNSVIPFIQEYEIAGGGTRTIPYTAPDRTTPRDEYTFWLGVSDAGVFLQNKDADHSTQYDMVQTKVRIEEGKPFKITGGIESGISGKTYNAGQKLTIKWDVDNQIFDKNSRVKISLSDDFGKTYKYVLIASTENDGEAEITLPNIEIGEISHTPQMRRPAGILKIEVLDHIAVAVTENNPAFGGFQIKKSNITLVNLPKEQYIKVKENAIPTVPTVTATSTCRNTPNPSVNFSEKNNRNILERTWTATDSCGNTATFTQFIEKEKEVAPLQFVNAPRDIQLACVKDIPKSEILQVIGGTNPVVEFSQSKINTNQYGTGLIIKRTWVATDTDAQSISHSQTILVRDYVPPVLSAYPKDKIVKSQQEIPPIAELTATDNCGNPVKITPYSGYKQNDEQGRIRQYHSWLAVDDSGNETYHEQIFTIDPNHTPTPATPPLQWSVASLPEVKVSCQSEIPSAQNPQTTGGKGKITITHQDTKTNNYCNETIVRTYTATDEDGKSITLTQNIKVEDNTAPIWDNANNLPQNITIEEGQNIPAQVDLTATDNCGEATVTKSESRENGKVIYTWTATDVCGNRVEHTQTITINPRKIPLAWAGTLPAENISASCDSVPTVQTLRTNKGEEITATETRQNGNCPNSYTLTRTWTANYDNEQISHTQNIKVEDNIAPTWNNANDLPQNLVIEEGQNIPVQVELTASDNCGVATVTKSESRENGKVIYTWTATDACGNRVEHTQTITINPKPIAPITWISQLPQNVRVSCAGNVPNAENLTATGGQGLLRITHNDVRSAETCANKYVITRTYTATDGVRSIQYTQTIEVNDDIAPSFVGDLPQNITIEEGQNVPTQANLTAIDNCGVANVETSEREVLENGKLKQKIYTWVAKDVCGNQIQHEQIIEIKEKKVEVPIQSVKPKLYPNPTNDSFQLSIENVKGVKVYNTAGRLVKTFEPQQKYDISNLTSEVYIIAVETEKGMEYIKLIKR